MKQIRKISNLVAEELINSGMDENDEAFEGKVSEIVDMISEACKGKTCEEDEETDDGDDEYPVDEESTFYMVDNNASIKDFSVVNGQYVEVEDNGEDLIVTIYDEDGEVIESDIVVAKEDLDELIANAEEIEIDDEDEEVDEAKVKKYKISHGKKVKLSKNQLMKNKLKARGKLKKGYKFVDGHQVKMSAAEKKARKKIGKKLAKLGKASRKKSLAKAASLNNGATSGTIKEGFDLSANGVKIALNEGDEIIIENGLLTVVREGVEIVSGVEISEDFVERCITEGVLEATAEVTREVNEGIDEEKTCESDEDEEDEDEDDEEDVEEGAVLSFKSNKGYILVKEGVELPMGNRIRARATLTSNGYKVTSEMLDKASCGELVTL